MNIPTYFARFLKEIRLTENQMNDLIKGHTKPDSGFMLSLMNYLNIQDTNAANTNS